MDISQVLLYAPERYLKWADCILLVFSITSRESFRAMDAYLAAWTNNRERSVRFSELNQNGSVNLASVGRGGQP